jgi:perosamine synthetase
MGLIKLPEASVEFFKANLDAILDSGNFAESVWNRTLAEFARDYCHAACATPTASNGSGMMALLQIYKEIDQRSRVLLQSNTMYGVKTMTTSAGMEICGYIDCNPMTLMPDLADVDRAVRNVSDKRSLVVLLSHIGGTLNPSIVDIAAFCKSNHIVLLEDCAHSFGATLGNKHSGTFGDGGVFSFYATKAIPAGEGGLVVTNDTAVGAMLDDYVKYDRFNRVMPIGLNIRPSEVQALLIYAAAKEVEQIIQNKAEIASAYVVSCEALSIPFIPQHLGGQRGNYYKFIVLSKGGDIAADLPKLKTMTSKVYDYYLGDTQVITTNHACLPIWYDQPAELTAQVVEELEACADTAAGSEQVRT